MDGQPTNAPRRKSVVLIKGALALACFILGAVSLLATGPMGKSSENNSSSPAFACPADITQPTDPATCSRVVNYTPPAPDAGGSVTCDRASGSTFPVGTTVVTCRETSAGGTVLNECRFNVTIQDREQPVFTCPPTVEANASDAACQAAVPNLTNGLVVSDNCSPAAQISLTQNPVAGTMVGKGDHNIEIVARDAAGNEKSCTTIFRVLDKTAPTLSGLTDVTINNSPGQCAALLTYVLPVATDSCDGAVPVTCTPLAGTRLPVGVHTVTCIARDNSANQATGSFQANVRDNEPPVIQCPSNIDGLFAQTPQGAIAVFGVPVVSDNCGVRPPSCQRLSGTMLPIGSTSNRCAVSDIHGNDGACSFSINVIGPKFTLEVKDRATKDYFQIVTCKTVPFHYGYWEYHRVPGAGPEEIFYGYANSITTVLASTNAEDTTSKDFKMTATFNPFSGIATAEVTILSSGAKRRLVGTEYTSKSCN